MRIEKVTIKNYRSFDDGDNVVVFPDIKQPISIVGYNNSGKSNLIQAILNSCGQREKYYTYTKSDFFYEDTSKAVEVITKFDSCIPVTTIYQTDKECWGASLDIKKVDKTISGYSHALGESGKLIIGQERIKGRGIPVLFNKLKDKLPLAYIDYRNIDNHLKVAPKSLLGKIIEEVKQDFKLDSNLIEVKGQQHKRNEYYTKLVGYIEKELLKTPKLDELLGKISKNLKEELEINKGSMNLCFSLPDPDSLYDSISFKISDCEQKPALTFDRLGDGFKAMLVMAMIQVLIEAEDGGNIIILEEPETFLHEHYQEFFYQLLKKLSQNNQVIYTTHSKKFTDIFNPASIIRLENESFQKSNIVQKPASTIDTPEEIGDFKIGSPGDFPKYLRTLEPNIGNIIFAEKVIVVEGPLDILAYKTILSERVNFSLHNIAIVAAWGKDPIISIVQLCNLFNIPCFAIHDYDIAGSEAQSSQERAQNTKNEKISSLLPAENLHLNKKNLETILGIEPKDKNASVVFSKVNGLSIDQAKNAFPGLISENLLNFLEI